ncbi:MAG TPA: helix-turn-helix domain-containing protein [Anaerolineae bacterium]|nr:helix-turn-helix domain-containing protein [Anaerolineae bacterium]
MQTAPVALSELLRLAFPGGSEFIGTSEQRSHVVQWATVINLPLHDESEVEEDDLVLLPVDAAESDLLAAIAPLSDAEVAAAVHVGPLPEPVIKAARQAKLPIIILPNNASLRQMHQAALTLITNRQAQMTQRAAQVRQQLEQLVAEGAGLEAIVWAMADLTRKGVIMQDKRLIPVATWTHPTLGQVWNDVLQSLGNPDLLPKGWNDRKFAAAQRRIEQQTLPGGLARYVTPIVVKGMARGYLSLVGIAEELDELDGLVAEQGAEACALEMAKAKAVNEVTKQMRGEFVDAVLGARVAQKEIEQWARQLGHDITVPHAAITFRWEGENHPSLRRLETAINGEISLTRVSALIRVETETGHAGAFVALESVNSVKPARDLAAAIYSRTMAEYPKATLRCGIGRPVDGITEWRTSYREAEQALEMASQLDERQPIFFGDLSVYRLLFKMAEHPDLVSFCNETLGALTHYDKEQNSNLVETLEAFFAHHGNLSQTAEALFIHRNTLQYRMDRIAEIASIDLDNPETRLALQLAIKAHRLLNAKVE